MEMTKRFQIRDHSSKEEKRFCDLIFADSGKAILETKEGKLRKTIELPDFIKQVQLAMKQDQLAK